MALPGLGNQTAETIGTFFAASEASSIDGKLEIQNTLLKDLLNVAKTIEYSMNQVLMGALDTITSQNNKMIELMSMPMENRASEQFQSEENIEEEARSERKSLFQPFNRDGSFNFGEMIGNIGKSLGGLLAGGSLLGFLYFLPEFLNSKLFAEMKTLIVEKIIPLFKMLYNDVLKPIGTVLYDAVTNFMTDLNDPNKGLWNVLSENAVLLLGTAAAIFALKFPAVAKSLAATVLSTISSLILNPITLGIAATVAGVAVLVSGISGAADALENAGNILNKANEDITLADKASLLVSGFLGGVASLIDTVLGFFGFESNLQTKVFNFMLDKTNDLFNTIQDWIGSLIDNIKIAILDLSPDFLKGRVADFLNINDQNTINAEIDRASTDVSDQESIISRRTDSRGSRYTSSGVYQQDQRALEKKKDKLKQLKVQRLQSEIEQIDVTYERIQADPISNMNMGEGLLRSERSQQRAIARMSASEASEGSTIDAGSRANSAETNVINVVAPNVNAPSSTVNNIDSSRHYTTSAPQIRTGEPTLSSMSGLN